MIGVILYGGPDFLAVVVVARIWILQPRAIRHVGEFVVHRFADRVQDAICCKYTQNKTTRNKQRI